MVVVLFFAIRGWIRGFLSQLFAAIGVAAALWVAGFVSQWVGVHWLHARPTAVFFLLRIAVVLLAGAAVVALFRWLGDLAREASRDGPLAYFDGPGGMVLGTALGLCFVTVMMFVALQMPWPSAVPAAAARARLAAPMMKGAAETCGAVRRYSPGWEWLRERFLRAERRALAARDGGTRSI